MPIRTLTLSTLAALALTSAATARDSDHAQPMMPNRQWDEACAFAPADRAWLQGALDAWVATSRRHLKLDPSEPPTVLAFDAACSFAVGPDSRFRQRGPSPDPSYGGWPYQWSARRHDGMIEIPTGDRVPAGVVAFAAPFDGDRQRFMLMGLPSAWAAGGVTSDLGLETLMTGVFIHEMTHTRQFYFVAPKLAALTARYGLPDDLDDDSLQKAFKGDAAYVAAWTAERDLLLAALAEPDDAAARTLAAQALALAKTRRARWFTGEAEKWKELEDVFLTMEGLGQWAAYAWLTDPAGGKVAPDRALAQYRRGGRFWSQDEGLLLFLLIDRLVPGWQAQAFAAEPATALRLWEQAAG